MSISGMALSLVMPVIIGPIAFVAMQGIKAASAVVDALPPLAKRFAVALIAVVLTLVGGATGVDLSCNPDAGTTCLEVLDKDAVKAILSTGIAFALHWAKKQKDTPKANP